VVNNTQNGVPTGGMMAEIMERQRLHQKFERYVHEEDLKNQRDNLQEAKERIRGTTGRLVPDDEPLHYVESNDSHYSAGRGVAEPYEVQIESYGNTLSTEMNEINQQRQEAADTLDSNKLCLRDYMYGKSPFAAELQGPGKHSGDPLGLTPPAALQKAPRTDGDALTKKMDAQIAVEEAKTRIYEDRRARYQCRPFNEVMNPLTGERQPAFTSGAQSAHVSQVEHVQRTRMAAQSAMMTRAGERAYKGGVTAASKSFYALPQASQ